MSKCKKKKSFNLTLNLIQRMTLIFFNRTRKNWSKSSTMLHTSVNFKSKTLVIRFSRLLTSKKLFFHATQVRSGELQLRNWECFTWKNKSWDWERKPPANANTGAAEGLSASAVVLRVCACVSWAWYTFWLSNVHVLKTKFKFFSERRG